MKYVRDTLGAELFLKSTTSYMYIITIRIKWLKILLLEEIAYECWSDAEKAEENVENPACISLTDEDLEKF